MLGTLVLGGAAVISSVSAALTLRDARRERHDRALNEGWLRLRAAHDDLGDALLDLAKCAKEATHAPGRYSYTLARIRAEHMLRRAIHPDIEEAYGEISDVIETPPERLELEDVDRALNAVFRSSESIGDYLARLGYR